MGLAIPYHHLHRPEPKPTGVVLGKLYPHDDDAVAQSALRAARASREAAGGAAPQSAGAVGDGADAARRIDRAGRHRRSTDGANYGWSPMQLDTGKPSGSLVDLDDASLGRTRVDRPARLPHARPKTACARNAARQRSVSGDLRTDVDRRPHDLDQPLAAGGQAASTWSANSPRSCRTARRPTPGSERCNC